MLARARVLFAIAIRSEDIDECHLIININAYSARWTHLQLAVQAPIQVGRERYTNETEFTSSRIHFFTATHPPNKNKAQKGPTWPFDPRWVLLHMATDDF